MTRYDEVAEELRRAPRTWLVTGCAGFIGSNLTQRLLELGQTVTGLDNLATGFRHNLDDVRAQVGEEAWARFRFVEGDITRPDDCAEAAEGAEIVLHHAALGSVPRSLANPVATHQANATGTLNVLEAARQAGAARFVYASSSSVYGDSPELPRREERVGRALSPYAVSKYAGEMYTTVFHRSYGLEAVALRYFNVFGPRQTPEGPYAAVVPRWIAALLAGQPCQINGDGRTSRDFCYVENVLQANLLAAAAPDVGGEVFNVACGEETDLLTAFRLVRDGLACHRPEVAAAEPEFGPFRPGDVRHTLADISRTRERLGYACTHSLEAGLDEALAWYVENLGGR